ncbi:Asp-tRNA(Asn)/Glu-tRNA(Gln) amidotransferase subunit GatC [Candidatus Omnitrophota bacterium]
MTINRDTVKKVALLSRLKLSDKELEIYSRQLETIIKYIDKLNGLNTDGVPPTSHTLSNLKNVFRKDELRQSLKVEDALKNAPSREGGFFKIPKVIEGK